MLGDGVEVSSNDLQHLQRRAVIWMTPNLFSMISALLTLSYSTLCLALSLVLRTPILAHSLKISGISIRIRTPSITIHNIRVSFPERSIYPSTSIVFAALSYTPHIPKRSSPKYATITLTSALLVSRLSSVSTTRLTVDLILFPALSRLSAGPPAQVTLDGFRLRIFSSENTPLHVQRLRRALVGTLLFGEILRCDDFDMQVTFGRDSTALDGPGADALGAPEGERPDVARLDEDAKTGAPPDEDDLFVTATTDNLHMHDRKGRVYAFEYVCAGLRRSWGGFRGARGSYEMEAENGRWMRLPPFVRGERGLKELTPWRYILMLPVTLPLHLHTLFTDPLRFIDLTVPNAQIQFDDFRMRDAELVRQGFEAAVKACMGVPVIPGG